jgi:hypothetical protein
LRSSSSSAGHPLPHRAVSVSCAEASRWQQQQMLSQQGGLVQQASVSAAAAAAGPRGFTEAGGGPSRQHHNQLRATWSEFGLLGRKPHTHQQQQWQQQMHGSSVGFTGGTLQDGGPTDESLLSHACIMTPSRTAAVQHSAVVSPRTAAAADVGESLPSPFMQIQQPVADALPHSVGSTQATDPSSAAAAAGTAADGWLPTLQSCTAQVDDATATLEPGNI